MRINRHILLVLLFMLSYGFANAQEYDYDKVYEKKKNNENWIMVKKDGMFGFIDKNGNTVVEPKYEKIEFLEDADKSKVKVKREGEEHYLNREGEEIE